MEKYGRMTPFFDVALIPCDHCAHVFLSKTEVHYLCDVMWKTTSAKKMFQSRMFDGKDSVKAVWRHGKKMSYQNIANVYFTQKTPALIDA